MAEAFGERAVFWVWGLVRGIPKANAIAEPPVTVARARSRFSGSARLAATTAVVGVKTAAHAATNLEIRIGPNEESSTADTLVAAIKRRTNHTTRRPRETHAAFGAIMEPLIPHGEEIHMTDEVRGAGGEKPDPEAVGEVEAMNWACTVCGYSVEGELPEQCPDCGAGREEFENVPIPGM